MAETFNPLALVTFTNDISAVNIVNQNFTAIASLFNDVLARSGASPNQMNSSLDMNGHNILNLAVPQSPTSPVRLIDILAPGSSFTIPPTGTSGPVVGFLNGNNTYSGTSLFTQAITLDADFTQAPAGSSGGYSNSFFYSCVGTGNPQSATQYAQFLMQDNGIASGTNSVSGVQHFLTLTSTSIAGIRAACSNEIFVESPTSPSNPSRNYFGTQTLAQANTADNGTALTLGASAGALLGLFTQAELLTGATNWFQVCGQATRIAIDNSSSAFAKTAIQVGSTVSDRTSGAVVDTMIWMINQNGSNPGWTTGILFDGSGSAGSGAGFFPMKSTGTFIKSTGGTVTTGVDFTNTTFIGNSFQSPGFSVGPGGQASTGAIGIQSGAIFFTGNNVGAGTLSLAVDATGSFLQANGNVFKVTGGLSTNTPTTVTAAAYTTLATDISLIYNLTANNTTTFPTPSTSAGRWLYIKTIGNFSVVSASSNIIPLHGGAAQTAVLPATIGSWATLASDGVNWNIMASGTN